MSKKGFDFQESYFSGRKELKGDSGINQKKFLRSIFYFFRLRSPQRVFL